MLNELYRDKTKTNNFVQTTLLFVSLSLFLLAGILNVRFCKGDLYSVAMVYYIYIIDYFKRLL